MNELSAWISVVSSFIWMISPVHGHCPRESSRIVRNVLKEDFFPAYEEHNVEVPLICPLHQSYDMFSLQEQNKVMNYGAEWNCDFCGKSFYSEHYLDQHFENKHSDKLILDSAVCLSDYCDLFRCDVYSISFKDQFWAKSLCQEDVMDTRRKRCHSLLRTCIPQGNSSSPSTVGHIVYDIVTKNICSKLNCKDYWKFPDGEFNPGWVIYYVTVIPFFLVPLVIYYYHVWEYYCLNVGDDVESWRESVDYAGGPRQRSVKRRRVHEQGDVHMY